MNRLTIIVIFLITNVFGQQQNAFLNYNQNPYIINEALSGAIKSSEVILAYNQLFGIDGAPKNYSLSGIMPIENKNITCGALFSSDKIGTFSNNQIKLSFAYRINFKDEDHEKDNKYEWHENSLSFGLSSSFSFINDLIGLQMPNDLALSNKNSSIPINFGFSTFYNHKNFFTGLSINNFMQSNKENLINNTNLEQEMPMYFIGGYRYFINDKKIKIEPNILIRHNFSTSILMDFNMDIEYKKMFQVGIGYRNSGAINTNFGVKLLEQKMRIIYTANFYRSTIFSSSHGITIGCFL